MSLYPRTESAAVQTANDVLVRTSRYWLSSAALKTLKANPATLLLPPAPAFWIYPTEIIATFHAGTDAFTTVYPLAIRTASASGQFWGAISGSGFTDQTTDQAFGEFLGGGGLIGATAPLTGQPLLLTHNGADEFAGNDAGDAYLILDLFYRVHPA